jgi:hypothetical protein
MAVSMYPASLCFTLGWCVKYLHATDQSKLYSISTSLEYLYIQYLHVCTKKLSIWSLFPHTGWPLLGSSHLSCKLAFCQVFESFVSDDVTLMYPQMVEWRSIYHLYMIFDSGVFVDGAMPCALSVLYYVIKNGCLMGAELRFETVPPCSTIIHTCINLFDSPMKLHDSVDVIASATCFTLSCTWLDTSGLPPWHSLEGLTGAPNNTKQSITYQ